MLDHIYLIVWAQAVVAEAVQDIIDFPPRQKPASFNLDRVMEQLEAAGTSA
jgi:arylsulfatase